MTLSKSSRVLLAIGSLLLAVTFFVPLWQIMLWAPQYPEGLTMKIWHNALSGDVDIINGLNHYIGMKHISVDMFPEFQYIGILLGILMAVGLAAALFGSARILFFFTLLSYVYGGAALWDFWRWGYEYGHHLDPNAAIKVEGMAYQPPVIGYKNLLNFTAYSGPDTGAWVIIGVCLLATAIWWLTFFKARKEQSDKSVAASSSTVILGTLGLICLMSCNTGPAPLAYGKDACSGCKMTLTDQRFGAEVVSVKGKVFKFDDLNCLTDFLKKGELRSGEIGQIVTIDFNKPSVFIPVQQAFFLKNEALKSPMRSDIASFASEQECEQMKQQMEGGSKLNWEAVKAEF